MSRADSGVAILAAAAFACVVLGPASARTQAGPKYGGTVVVGIGGDPPFLDPSLATGNGVEVLGALCEQLYYYNAKSQITPQLATALPTISADKLTYTIPLRQGIRFNDGTPFNADAVVASLQRMITLPGSERAGGLSSVDTVTISGPSTVVIHLKERFTPLTANLATQAGAVMSPTQLTKLGANFGTNPVCVGPFMFDHRVPGDNITVIKSPYYYNKYAVHLDKIVYKVTTDGAAAAAALRSGDLDVLSGIASTELPAIEQDQDLSVISAAQFGFSGIVINIGNKNGLGNLPYTNVGTPLASSAKLRQAFEEAIDRNTLNKVLYAGRGSPGCTPISPASASYDASLQCTPFKPKDAKKLVAASGFPNPTVHLLTTPGSTLAEFIQAEEAAVGINVVIESFDSATVNARRTSGNFDTLIVSRIGSADTDTAISFYVATSGSTNWGGYSNPQLDLILANGRKATSAAALRTLYHVAQKIILNDRPIIILRHGIKTLGYSTNLTGVQMWPDDIARVAFAQYK